MKRLSITILILSMVFAMACNKSAKEGSASNSNTTQSALASPESAKTSPITVANPNAATPLAVSQPVTAAGMNPPHGQPNHRCDIAVGAPLNSPPGTGLTKPITTQPNVTLQTTTPSTVQGQSSTQPKVSVQPTTPTTVAAGMNPPHGQPNHRCDIAVGAPLNSPPGKK
jgi:hypothetical protein